MQFWLHYQNPDFDASHVTGMWSWQHFLFVVFLLVIATVLLMGYFRLSMHQRTTLLKGYSFFLIGLEITRVSWNLWANDEIVWNDLLPLYTCGIFIFTMPLSVFKNPLQHIAQGFIKASAFLSGLAFILFPSTALVDYPIWHYNSIQSFVMHTSMMMIGFIYWCAPYEKSNRKDWMYFSIWVTGFAIVSAFVNAWTQSNFMFIGNPLENTPLMWVQQMVGSAGYGIVIILLHYVWGAGMIAIGRWIRTQLDYKISGN